MYDIIYIECNLIYESINFIRIQNNREKDDTDIILCVPISVSL